MSSLAFQYLAALFLTVVAVWRAPAALRYGDTQRRALCGCAAGFGASAWLQTPAVARTMEQTPVPEVSVLMQECLGTVAIMAIISYVGAVYGKTEETNPPRHVVVSRFIARISPRVGIAVLAALTLTFFTAVDRQPGRVSDFAADHAGEWGAALFLSIIYTYLAASCSVTGYQWAAAARRAETRLLRAGLVLMAIAMAIGMAYVVIRMTYIWVAVAMPASRSLSSAVAQVTGFMPPLLLLTFAAGLSTPATRAAIARWRIFRMLRELEPLWRDLVTPFPDLAFESALIGSPPSNRPTSLLHDLTDWSLPLRVRLSSRINQIADGVEQLRGYAPRGLIHAAEDIVEETPDPENPQALTEALYIKAALLVVAGGKPPASPTEPLPRKALARTDDEARWWSQVQRQYAAVTVDQAEEALRAVGPDLPEPSTGTHAPVPAAGGETPP